MTLDFRGCQTMTGPFGTLSNRLGIAALGTRSDTDYAFGMRPATCKIRRRSQVDIRVLAYLGPGSSESDSDPLSYTTKSGLGTGPLNCETEDSCVRLRKNAAAFPRHLQSRFLNSHPGVANGVVNCRPEHCERRWWASGSFSLTHDFTEPMFLAEWGSHGAPRTTRGAGN